MSEENAKLDALARQVQRNNELLMQIRRAVLPAEKLKEIEEAEEAAAKPKANQWYKPRRVR